MKPSRLRSFRLRVVIICSLGLAAIVLLFAALMHEWLRRDLIAARDQELHTQMDLVLGQPTRPIVWHEVEQRLRRDDSVPAMLVWMEGPQRFYVSKSWPASVSPNDIVPSLDLPDTWKSVAGSDGRLTDPPGDPWARGWDEPAEPPSRSDIPRTKPFTGTTGIVVARDPSRRYGAFTDGDATVLIGVETAPIEAELARFRAMLGTAVPFCLFLSVLVGLLIAERSLKPVTALADTMDKVTASGLDQRLDPNEGEREFARLVLVFNEMLARLERSFDESRRFADNAAHELRTPLTILQGKLDAAIRAEPAESERQQQLAVLLDEVARLRGITDSLLLLARSDAGRLELRSQSVDFSQLVEAMVEDARILAPAVFRIESRVPPGIECSCDSGLVAQAIHNMLSNAIKYNRPEKGFVRIDLVKKPGQLTLTVANTGKPIPEERQERIFERFYRADESRSRRVEGTGLGLSLARQVARSHGGDLTLVRSDQRETVFELRLPLAQSSTRLPAIVLPPRA